MNRRGVIQLSSSSFASAAQSRADSVSSWRSRSPPPVREQPPPKSEVKFVPAKVARSVWGSVPVFNNDETTNLTVPAVLTSSSSSPTQPQSGLASEDEKKHVRIKTPSNQTKQEDAWLPARGGKHSLKAVKNKVTHNDSKHVKTRKPSSSSIKNNKSSAQKQALSSLLTQAPIQKQSKKQVDV